MKKTVPLLALSLAFLSSCGHLAAPTTWEYVEIDFDLTPCERVDITYQNKKVIETYSLSEWDDICQIYDDLMILEYDPSLEINEDKLDYSKELLYFDFIGCEFNFTIIPNYYIYMDGTIKSYKSSSFYFDDLIEKVRTNYEDYLVGSEDR
ncbi:MAG: hypothetical protein LUB56_01225 [Coprobacillus sp.]|nr:hypothetical protein [Coprobacillus sp.]